MLINPKDKLILSELQKDSRLSVRELSKRTKVPATTVHDRIRRMVNSSVIKKFTTILDHEKVGLSTTAIILVKRAVGRKGKIKHEHIGETLAKLPEVQEVYVVTGEWDAILKVRGVNEREIGKWVVDKLWNMPEIDRTLTFFVFHTSKETTELKLF